MGVVENMDDETSPCTTWYSSKSVRNVVFFTMVARSGMAAMAFWKAALLGAMTVMFLAVDSAFVSSGTVPNKAVRRLSVGEFYVMLGNVCDLQVSVLSSLLLAAKILVMGSAAVMATKAGIKFRRYMSMRKKKEKPTKQRYNY